MSKGRMIRDFTRSEKMNRLSAKAESLFVRLMLRADDYGNSNGNLNIVKSECYPLGTPCRNADINLFIEEMKNLNLITIYVADAKSYIHIFDFNQKLRYPTRRFPPCPAEATKEKSSKKEKEVEVEREVVVEPIKDNATDFKNENWYKNLCYGLALAEWQNYFPALKMVYDKQFSYISEISKSDEEKNTKMNAYFINYIEPSIKKELSLFWAYNDAKEIKYEKRSKKLKLWLLRKK
jgi:hypothetical protein